MKITLAQHNIEWASPEKNREALTYCLNENKTDLFILPEMFSTGFASSPEGIAEESPSETLEWMKDNAARCNCAIAGSIALCENGSYFNRLYFVFPDKTFCFYDKHHLFTYSGEDRVFTAGNEKVIVTYKDIRFRLSVCYDLRFPGWLRNTEDYDALICVASWPETRRDAWDCLLQARAIENQAYVLGVNRVGCDPFCNYSGGTACFGPKGELIAKVEDGVCGTVSIDLNMTALEDFRKSFPVLKDRDK